MHASFPKVLVAIAFIVPAPSAFADVITDWNEKAVAFVTPRMPPPAAQRVVAMVHVAMFDAVNSVDRRYRPYLIQLPASPTAFAIRMVKYPDPAPTSATAHPFLIPSRRTASVVFSSSSRSRRSSQGTPCTPIVPA